MADEPVARDGGADEIPNPTSRFGDAAGNRDIGPHDLDLFTALDASTSQRRLLAGVRLALCRKRLSYVSAGQVEDGKFLSDEMAEHAECSIRPSGRLAT
jgi:hypothetical protein